MTYDTAPNGLGQLDSVQDTQSGYMRAMVYDGFGRVSEVVTNFDGAAYYEKTTYDEYGRVYQYFDAAGNGSYTDLGVANHYGAFGHLASIADAVEVGGEPRKVYRAVIEMNARGQVTIEQRGIDNTVANPQPSVSVSYGFDAATGRLETIDGVNQSGVEIQDLEYLWDEVGNLEWREDKSRSKNLHEDFTYDGLNRLKTQQVIGQTMVTVNYNSIGDITKKTDVSSVNHSYGTQESGCSEDPGPHAVSKAAGLKYCYDKNGNNTSGDGRTITYTTFDLPSQISDGHVTSFAYGPDRSRYRRIDNGTAGTTTTRYVGSVEIIFKPNGDQDRKRYIAGVAVETVHFGDNAIEDYRETQYLHMDHLGSLNAITDAQGALLQDLAFDAWGERRNPDTWGPYTDPQLIAFDHSRTTRGFTGHEMLDEVGIIHMNGRIYDPKLGRFLQADPFVQEPTNTQSLNRYSYVLNNPLNATDPSGYFIFSLIAAAAIFTAETTIAWEAIFGIMALAGFTDAMVAGASFQDALLAGISGGALSAIGFAMLPAGGFATELEAVAYAAKIGVVGGITSVLQGGRFGAGFRSAGIGSLVGSAANGLAKAMNLKALGQSVVSIVAGGTASALTGGKFANGAMTTAFQVTVASLTLDSRAVGGGDRGDASKVGVDERPSYDEMARSYPLGDPKDVFESIGGKVAANGLIPADEGGWVNSCSVRLSASLNASGETIPFIYPNETVSGADGNWYIFRVRTVETYLNDHWGPPDIVSTNSTDYLGHKGIILFDTTGTWSNATGHTTLWNGAKTIDTSDYFKVSRRVMLWKLPD